MSMHNSNIVKCTCLLLSLISATVLPLRADDSDYSRNIKPLLKARCFACHGALKQEAGLRLDTGELIRKGSENGSVVDVENPKASELLIRISADDDSIRMPPIGHPLTSEEQQLFASWITAGAQSPANESREEDPREHWAFIKPIRPDVPATNNQEWVFNSIDAFVLSRAEHAGLNMSRNASPAHLLRRLHIDLTGLPPTPEQIKEFTADPTQDRYEEVVKHLLDSDAYAERWGRHWMDIWRYSDWYGRRNLDDVRNSAPQIWRWRDWIIESLRNDKGYDQMLREMLAADELHPNDDSTWPATGYLIRSYYSLNLNEWMRHNVEYTAKAFMGLTVNCAHCHDHKYDPIEHDDYFRLRAFFEPMGVRQDQVSGQDYPGEFPPYTYGGSRPVTRDGMVRIFDEASEKPTWFYTDGDERNKKRDRGSIPPGVPEFIDVPFPEITPITLPIYAWNPGSRPHIQQEHLKKAEKELEDARTAHDQTKSSVSDNTELKRQLDAAELEFDTALESAIANGESGPIDGDQSVLLDATEGRFILHHSFPGFTKLVEGAELTFEFTILQDKHFNFQLAQNTETHRTALYLGFVEGAIRGYQPGTHTELTLGRYDVSKDERRLKVRLTIHEESDTARVHIKETSTDKIIVNDVPIALNGWNSAKHKNQPITFDTRTGSKVLLDNVTFKSDDFSFSSGFEPPLFSDGMTPVGTQDWYLSKTGNVAPAFAAVSRLGEVTSAKPAYEALQTIRSRLANQDLPHRAAALRLAAATETLATIEAIVEADTAVRDGLTDEEFSQLAKVALDMRIKSDIAVAEAELAEAMLAQFKAGELGKDDDGREAAIKQAADAVTAAEAILKTANNMNPTKFSKNYYRGLSPSTSKTSTGRRAALANWITDKRHPLTPRVAVNHIWGRHFHQPIVSSVTDFGRNGRPPSHPQLLDWLAIELIENNWSMKHIHNLIVTSHVYQQSSSQTAMEANEQIDPDNILLWRMNQGRMEAEVVRDSILAIGKTLDTTVGGQVLLNTTMNETTRRSLYYEVYPEAGGNSKMSELFDPPNPTECYRRSVSVVPQQALAMSNGTIIHSNSLAVAKELADADDSQFISDAFLLILNRRPTDQEQQLAQKYLTHRAEELDTQVRRQGLIRALFNHNDFISIR